MQLADEIVVVANGEIRSSGSKDDVLPKLLGEFDDICDFTGRAVKSL
jgi:ABC-type molybdate transport system ATPase subunit